MSIVKIDDEITGSVGDGDGVGRAGGKIVQISNSDSDETSNRVILERTVISWWNKSEFATRANGVFVLCHVDGVIHAIVDLSNGNLNLGCCSFGIRGSAEPINSVYSNMLGALTFFSNSRRLFSQMFSVWC